MGLSTLLKRTVALVPLWLLAVTTVLVVAAVAVAMPTTAEADTPGPTTAGAVNTGPENIPIPSDVDVAGCPSGNYLATNPGSGQTTVFLLVPAGGPPNCPTPVAAMFNPGHESSADQAVALPLTASSCQAGAQLLNNELGALGQQQIGSVGSGPPPGPGPGSPCPLGDAALTALQSTIVAIPPTLATNTVLIRPVLPGIILAIAIPTFLSVTKTAGDTAVQSSLPTAFTGIYAYRGGTPTGGFLLAPNGSLPGFYRFLPSGTAGVASVVCAFCSG